MIKVRTANSLDAASMARILNAIIEKGGTTAFTHRVTDETIIEWMCQNHEQASWQVALNNDDAVVGFQWVKPDEAVDIATFVQTGQTGLGIGSLLFKVTQTAAKAIGYKWINANIRADNKGGLIYYKSLGFVEYEQIQAATLENGQVVGKILKRFEIKI
jgi:L-amino acid N-acyltransferase YncA